MEMFKAQCNFDPIDGAPKKLIITQNNVCDKSTMYNKKKLQFSSSKMKVL